MKTVTNTSEVRISNATAIYKLLRKNGITTKSKIAKNINISFASASNICNQLIDKNLLIIEENIKSTGGRKAANLAVNSKFGNIMVIDLHNTYQAQMALLSMDGTIIKISRFSINEDDSLEVIFNKIQTTYKEFKAQFPKRIIGVCVGISAVYVEATGITISSSNPVFEGINLKRSMEEIFPTKIVVVENDANLAALSEIQNNETKESFLNIFLTQGVGLGLVLNGELYKGANGFAGELGHIKVREINKKCKCGHVGCLRTVATLESIAIDLGEISILKECSTPMEYANILAERYENSEQAVIDRVNLAGTKLGEVISGLQDIFNPHKIILSGNMCKLFPYIIQFARITSRELSKFSKTNDLEICFIDKNSNDIILSGGCEKVLNKWLDTEFPKIINK
jgi:predicted NBD/HSP70 family sugar kinase